MSAESSVIRNLLPAAIHRNIHLDGSLTEPVSVGGPVVVRRRPWASIDGECGYCFSQSITCGCGSEAIWGLIRRTGRLGSNGVGRPGGGSVRPSANTPPPARSRRCGAIWPGFGKQSLTRLFGDHPGAGFHFLGMQGRMGTGNFLQLPPPNTIECGI